MLTAKQYIVVNYCAQIFSHKHFYNFIAMQYLVKTPKLNIRIPGLPWQFESENKSCSNIREYAVKCNFLRLCGYIGDSRKGLLRHRNIIARLYNLEYVIKIDNNTDFYGIIVTKIFFW